MTKKEKLVDLLRQDARLSNEQLAAMLDTSADDVAAMIAELEKSGMIIGYTAIINEEEFDRNSVCAFIEVRVSPEILCGYTALLPFIRNCAVSLMRMLPRPFACAVIDLRNIAVFINFSIDKLNITVIVFRLLIHKVEQTFCSC